MINLKSAFGLGLASIVTVQATAQKTVAFKQCTPNIVLILMDDMGYGDIGRTGANQYETPNLNRFANQGLQFTWYYSPQAVSSASRAGLLTGCYPNRIGISGALMPWAQIGINSGETTIAEMLKSKGYLTSIIGKWHLGHHKEFLPLQHGFDEYYGIPYSNDMWPVDFDGVPIRLKDTTSNKMKYPVLPLIEGNDKVGEVSTLADQDKLTTTYTERAVKFIDQHKKDRFFLYLPHSMVHIPLGVSEKFKGKSKQGMYGDVMMEVDWSIGEIMKALERNGLDKNTLVIFTSDNGPWLNFGNHAGTTGGLREGKGTSWEGGQRVPCIMRWPGVIPEGEICSKIACAMDILPTLASITGAQLPDKKIDGISLLPLLLGDRSASPRHNFYYYYQQNSLEGVQKDYWKLVLPHKGISYVGVEPGKDGWPGKTVSITITEPELYDLRRDPGERYNVASVKPEVVRDLQALANEARQDLGDDITKVMGANRRKPGTVDDRLISSIDFGPTVLSLAGVPVPAHMQGIPFLGDQVGKPRDAVFAARDRVDESYDMIRSVRTKEFLYIRNYYPNEPFPIWVPYLSNMPIYKEMLRLDAEGKLNGAQKSWMAYSRPPEELYEVKADPLQLKNLANDPKYKTVIEDLRKRHQQWTLETGDMGHINEPEMVEKMWPGGKQPVTDVPSV